MQITTIVQNDKEFASADSIGVYSNNRLASDDFHVYLENMREEFTSWCPQKCCPRSQDIKTCTKVIINNDVKYTKELLLSMLEDMRTSQDLKVVTVQFYQHALPDWWATDPADKEFTFEITQVITCEEDFPTWTDLRRLLSSTSKICDLKIA